MRPKRKHQKSGEKLSPLEKKTKSLLKEKEKSDTAMSETKPKTPPESTGTPKARSWEDLVIKIDDIAIKTDDIAKIRKSLDEVKAEIGYFKKRYQELELTINKYTNKTEELEKGMD